MAYNEQTAASGAKVNLFTLPEEIQPYGVPVMTPLRNITHVGGDTWRIDSRISTHDNGSGVEQVTGGAEGIHFLTLTGAVQELDIAGAATPATYLPGSNVTAVGNGYAKSIDGNGWNASVASVESFDPRLQDFAVTWDVEQAQASMNEMAGLTARQMTNQSYNTIDYALYQVNNYLYGYVYESGSRLQMSGYTTHYPAAGDRFGVRCVNGVITYFVMSAAGIVKDVHTSSKKAESPLFWRGAFYRGTNQAAGASMIGGVQFHTATKVNMKTVQIAGNANSTISAEDALRLEALGMFVNPTAKYSDIHFERPVSIRFPANSAIDLSHLYCVNAEVGMETINF